MRANTSRGGRLRFDELVDAYDGNRPVISAATVSAAMRVAGLEPGARVLEIGAATGQLTFPLLRAGLEVVALEPGAALRERLRAHADGHERLTVRGELFEDYPGEEAPFAAVWSANAFHWVDPAVSYARAAELLVPGGHLALVWTYPILPARLQRRLNEEVFAELDPNFVRDPDTHLATIERGAAEGRAELVASGHYEPPWAQLRTESFTQSAAGYVAHLCSYGNAAELDADTRETFVRRVHAVLDDEGSAEVTQTVHVSVSLAQRGP